MANEGMNETQFVEWLKQQIIECNGKTPSPTKWNEIMSKVISVKASSGNFTNSQADVIISKLIGGITSKQPIAQVVSTVLADENVSKHLKETVLPKAMKFGTDMMRHVESAMKDVKSNTQQPQNNNDKGEHDERTQR